MRDETGVRVVRWCGRTRVYRVGQLVSRYRETWLRVLSPRRWYLLVWLPRQGWHLQSSGITGTPYSAPDYRVPLEELDVKRRASPAAGVETVVAALPATSVVLGKIPAIREFLTATSYEDGTARIPGYLTVRNRTVAFEVTLYDPDSGTRLPVRAAKIDDVLLLAEQLLGVSDAAWEPDDYLLSQLEKKAKKKKK